MQGLFGGLRVLRNDPLLANLHACAAPVLFGLCAALATLTSTQWNNSPATAEHPNARLLRRLALVATVGLYVEIVLGVQVRHLPLGDGPKLLALWVYLHLIAAALDLAVILWLLPLALVRFADCRLLVRRIWLLAALFVAESAAGALAWVVKYGWPGWFNDYVWPMDYTVQWAGSLRAAILTAHVALGALTLSAALSVALWSLRLVKATTTAPSPPGFTLDESPR